MLYYHRKQTFVHNFYTCSISQSELIIDYKILLLHRKVKMSEIKDCNKSKCNFSNEYIHIKPL